MFSIRDNEIGGAIVRRQINTGGKAIAPGTRLSRSEVLAFLPVNRMALINKRFLDVYPIGGGDAAAATSSQGERFVVSAGFGRFHVIEGKKLNDEAIDREQAYALAGIAAPEKATRRRKPQPTQ